ncbi:MAG: glycoside hydrolase domain-containing protein [Trueperaceae bacterium]
MKVVAVSSLESIGLGQWQNLAAINTLRAAKNETESFQLVVRAPLGGLSNVRVRVEPFRNEAGETLPSPTLYREHYVYAHSVEREYYKRDTYTATNIPGGAGWYADALIPFEVNNSGADDSNARFKAQPFNVASSQNQPIWIDVYVSADAAAGRYESTYTVSSDEGEVSGNVSLEVWDFTLPESPSLGSSFLVWEQNNLATYKELLNHKLMPDYVEREFQSELIEDYGLRLLRLGFVGGASYKDCTMNPPPALSEVENNVAAQDQRLSLYIYPADEITDCLEITPEVRAWGDVAHAANVKQLIPMFPRSDLYEGGEKSAVDIWVIYATQLMTPGAQNLNTQNLNTQNPDAQKIIQDVLAKGDEVWSYTALAAEPYAPQWALNYGAFDHRLLAGFISMRYGMTGLLYWRVDNWSEDPWWAPRVASDPSNYPAGEGMLLYPGDAVGIDGVVPSIRLKWLRDGVEDYEYGQLLNDASKEDALQSIVMSVARDWYHWTRDVSVLETAREQLARAILE